MILEVRGELMRDGWYGELNSSFSRYWSLKMSVVPVSWFDGKDAKAEAAVAAEITEASSKIRVPTQNTSMSFLKISLPTIGSVQDNSL